MKTLTALLLLTGAMAIGPLPAAEPPAGRPDPDSMKLLRQTLADQARHPDKIIRNYTNAAPPQARADATQAGSPAEIPVFKPEPPRADPVSTKAAAAAALEKQFLEGKISERQYKKALADLERANTAPGGATGTAKPAKPAPAKRGQLPPAEPDPPATPPPAIKQQKVSEAETKLDELILQKEARDRAAQTNTVPSPVAGATKRQRLDFLLKQVVEGKITDEEYKRQREKILAEAD